MAFCSNCGKLLAKNARFCSECGSDVQLNNHSDYKFTTFSQNDTPTRKINYDGEILKCPQCGEALKSFESVCPTCGYELRNIRNSNAVQELAQTIDQIESERKQPTLGMALLHKLSNKLDATDERKISLIANFPIPNTKEDIREFLIMASANRKPIDYTAKEIAIAKAWKNKYKQAKRKASLIFDKYEFRQLKKLLR